MLDFVWSIVYFITIVVLHLKPITMDEFNDKIIAKNSLFSKVQNHTNGVYFHVLF